MQDLKNLSNNRRAPWFSHKNTAVNRRLPTAGARPKLKLSLPEGKRLTHLKHLLLFLAIILALTPVCLLVLHQAPRAVTRITAWLRTNSSPEPKLAEAARPPASNAFATASSLLTDAVPDGEHLSARTDNGNTILYSVQGNLQKSVHDFMAEKQVPYGVFVAVEPATGRLLAMTAYSSVDPQWSRNSFFDLYPMASLFKIVTASAALEHRKITPDTVVEFRGNAYSENPRYWEASPRGRNNRMDVSYAMGKSINPVYGRVAANIAGKELVLESARKFGFNQALLPGTPAKESKATDPQTSHDLMRMGAGLDHDVKISPLHAAVMMAAIANNGRMMAPSLADKLLDTDGKVLEAHNPREIRRLVSPETASSLAKMLAQTVTQGTSRKAFHDRQGRPRLNIDIAAKTGSINGTDPQGHYSWFAAYAPIKNPRIALVALVINQDKWKIKSSQVGEKALSEFFDQ